MQFHIQQIPWPQARNMCAEFAGNATTGYLLSVHSMVENAFLLGTLQGKEIFGLDTIWTGLRKDEQGEYQYLLSVFTAKNRF